MPNNALLSKQLAHDHYLRRYGTQVRNKMFVHIEEVRADILSKLAKLESIKGSFNERARLNALLDEITQIGKNGSIGMMDDLKSQLGEFATWESNYQRGLLSSTVGGTFNAPTLQGLRSAALSQPMNGRFLRQWALDLGADTTARVSQQIRIGFTQGESISKITARIRGTRATRYQDGIFATTNRQAEAIVRTAVNHVATAAREETWMANEDIIQGVILVVVLDSRTSPICREYAESQEVYKVGEGPRPPFHPNCRTTTSVVLKNESKPKIPSYTDWLKSQSADMQKEALGLERFKRFRDGEPMKFADRTGRGLTLAELDKRAS